MRLSDVDVLMTEGVCLGTYNPAESIKKKENNTTTRQSNRKATPVANITKQIDFGNLPSEKERRQDIVEGIYFQSGGNDRSGREKRKAQYLDNYTLKVKTQTLKQIPVCAGGPYLCDSDSDVTVPISVVEELETVEDEVE